MINNNNYYLWSCLFVRVILVSDTSDQVDKGCSVKCVTFEVTFSIDIGTTLFFLDQSLVTKEITGTKNSNFIFGTVIIVFGDTNFTRSNNEEKISNST